MSYEFIKNGSKGKIITSQAVIMKVFGSSIAYHSINRKSPWLLDIMHYGYGRINIKYSILTGTGRTEGYKFCTDRKTVKCDAHFFLGFDRYWENIDTVFVVPNNGWIKDIGTACICKNADDSKYKEFRIDAKPYNDAYHDFMSFIVDSPTVGVSDIKDWLRRGESDTKKDAVAVMNKLELCDIGQELWERFRDDDYNENKYKKYVDHIKLCEKCKKDLEIEEKDLIGITKKNE